jgi:hypothetical protein
MQKQKKQTDVAMSLAQHEQICAIRYENIEKRLESGSKRFARMEGMIIGIYALLIASQVMAQVL